MRRAYRQVVRRNPQRGRIFAHSRGAAERHDLPCGSFQTIPLRKNFAAEWFPARPRSGDGSRLRTDGACDRPCERLEPKRFREHGRRAQAVGVHANPFVAEGRHENDR